MTEPGGRDRRRLLWRVVQVLVSLAIVGGIFLYAIPKIANYDAVADALGAMTWLELATLVGAMLFNLYTYWLQNMASIPGLGLWQAAVNNQTTTSIANTIPGGGVLAVGIGYEMYRSWGFTASAIALSVVVTGIWNMFMKLGLPVAALAILAIEGRAGGGLLVAALIGVAILMAAVVLFALTLWKKALARRIGGALGRAASFLLRLVRKPSVGDWGERAVRFRRQTIDLVAGRWVLLTITTVVSHLALFVVLLLSLRHVGISEQEIGTAQILGVFAFGRLITALPITPGGVGFVELGYIGGLILAGRNHADVPLDVFRAQVVAAVLVFRALTYVVQIPLGTLTYLIWRAKKSWRKPAPAEAAAEPAPVA
ncbi:MAG: lysylphosphatidylglycerol synthase transmembrane domain-containing protein [Actinomycetota bacterium]